MFRAKYLTTLLTASALLSVPGAAASGDPETPDRGGRQPGPRRLSGGVSLLSAVAKRDSTFPTYEELYAQLTGLVPDASRIAPVHNFRLQRDVARFTLDEGHLYLLSPVDGRTVAAVFLGDGTFGFEPPTQVERDQLERHYESPSMEQSFKTLFLIFADSTLEEMEANLTFGADGVPEDVTREIREALDYLSDDKGKWFDQAIMTTFLNGGRTDLFYAHLAERRSRPFFFRIDPYDFEEISLSRRATGVPGKSREVVCQFHTAADYARGQRETEEAHDLVSLDDYAIASTIEDNLDFSATATFDVMAGAASLHWVPLQLYEELELDSAFWANGTPATYYRGEESTSLWLLFDPPLVAGSSKRLTVHYHGDLLEWTDLLRGARRIRDTNRSWMISMKSSTLWFPRYGGRRQANFDLTYRVPKDFKFVSVGERVFSEEAGESELSRWVAHSIRNVAFNLGDFDEYHLNDPRIPPVTLHVAENLHQNLAIQGRSGENVTFLLQKDMEEAVGADLANSLAFFQEFFGSSPVTRFYATEIPGTHGEAFPGLVLLSWLTFQWTGKSGNEELFRAHEVAHQWWGIGVDYATYHDRWISEGFSQFAGLWYMQTVLMDHEKYVDKLDEWRDEILDRGDELPPIWLGRRAGSVDHPDDYDLVVYRKGAWVIHMLRNLLLDLETMSEDRFKLMLSDFYNAYAGRRAATEDLKEVVERHVGVPMDWFFDQWVYGTAVPRYEYSTTGSVTEGGEYRMRLRVVQEDVPDDFKMYVPLLLDFGNDGFARLRMLVEGPVTEVALPLMPRKPDRFVFNDLDAVLATVKEVGWKN